MAKRLFDILATGLALPLLIPLALIVALMVRVKLGAPILFTQQRPGLHGKLFRMYKFRSMTDARDAAGRPLPDAERLTRFGAFLRAASLDELPGLWSVLAGDMSLVGPRPLLIEYLPLYNARQQLRHNVKPGITGLAQISGRNAISWEQKFALDVAYVEQQSFWLDLKILFKTALKVVKRDGISADGEATMQAFTGSPDGPDSGHGRAS